MIGSDQEIIYMTNLEITNKINVVLIHKLLEWIGKICNLPMTLKILEIVFMMHSFCKYISVCIYFHFAYITHVDIM